ncbi:MAG: PP2C family protein-serine/threonine phosphatase [Bacteroidota bacterium]|jgi:serine phosphatase RsbU (regulator of sigma subunit)
MSSTEIVFILISAVLFLLLLLVFFQNSKNKKHLIKIEKELINKTESETIWIKERSTILESKQKFEEKNKKLWSMSEAVHKERKKVDEENEKLLLEKEKLVSDKKKLDEKIKKLWQTSTAIHKEKERINELKLEIENKHQEIIDSVNYAKRIQRALLASEKLLRNHLKEYFIFFKPRDIVSGDFYWASETQDNKFLLAIADSTGHGVPGAIMSILNISALNEAVNAEKLNAPDTILNYSRKRIMEHMANDGSEEGGKDGMDCVLCKIDFEKKLLSFAAANNPLWIFRKNKEANIELIEIKPDKMPVGKAMGEIKPFSLHEISVQPGDLIIMITDGFADQFGGPNGKKFMYKPLKELLFRLNQLPMQEMKQELYSRFNEWKGRHEQVDDVLIAGIRV